MKLFRDYVMTWWQVGLLKALVFVVGLMLGAYFADVVGQYYSLLLVIFVVLAGYFLYAMFTDGFSGDSAGGME